jgi:hypothetical protein
MNTDGQQTSSDAFAVRLKETGSRPVVPSRAAHPEHVLTVGAALAFLTLSGGGRLSRAAARVEEAWPRAIVD